MQGTWMRILPTVFEWEIGESDAITPYTLFGNREEKKEPFEKLMDREEQELLPELQKIAGEVGAEGVLVRIPSLFKEQYYGLGLQLFSFLQNGKRKRLTANADAAADTGDSHAPVPFFVSSKGYGILIDSARSVEVDFGCSRQRCGNRNDTAGSGLIGASTEELYGEQQRGGEVTIFVKGAKGLRIHCFVSGSIKKTVEDYNLFCGGGCLPPIWGLGSLYRCYTRANQQDAEEILNLFEKEEMPFSMIGLEPGWQSHSYSCSYTWSEERFPEPERLIQMAKDRGMEVNLWEQAYVHPKAPFYREICPHSGDYEVWDGAVPDFALPEAGAVFGAWQENLIAGGIAAVKLDECDGSDYTGGWFFPDYAKFPSGLTGEQEKNLYGAMITRVLQRSFERQGKRTYSQIRANYSYGAPMPYVLYSDLYDHRQFVRALCNAGFCGLLWSPEVRQCQSGRELICRVQTTVFSPLSLINAWMIPNPPWKQYEIEKNLAGEFLADDCLEKEVRELLELRNRLVPYLYSAFYFYEKEGTPPFRPLVMDFPEDPAVWDIDDSYMMGDSLLVAPLFEGNEPEKAGRNVYLPEGKWYDFWSGDCYRGGKEYWIETEQIPVFVRDGSLIPLAKETKAPGKDTVFHLELSVYGREPKPFFLIEDDGISFAYRSGEQKVYKICGFEDEECLRESKRYRLGKTVYKEWKDEREN